MSRCGQDNFNSLVQARARPCSVVSQMAFKKTIYEQSCPLIHCLISEHLSMTLTDAVDEILGTSKDGPRVDIEFIQADKKRQTAGKLRRLLKCYTSGSAHSTKKHGTINIVNDHSDHPTPVHTRLITKVNNELVT